MLVCRFLTLQGLEVEALYGEAPAAFTAGRENLYNTLLIFSTVACTSYSRDRSAAFATLYLSAEHQGIRTQQAGKLQYKF